MRTLVLCTLLSIAATYATEAAGENVDKGWIGDLFEGLSVDVRTLEGADGGLGIDADWPVLTTSGSFGSTSLGKLGLAWGYKGEIAYEGRFGTQSPTNDATPRAQSLNADIYCTLKPSSGWWLALGGAPASVESDQDLEQVNYVLKPHAYFPVPGTGWMTRNVVYTLFGERKSAPPVYGKVGYALVSEIAGEGGRAAEDRWECQVLYDVKLNALLESKLNFVYRYFNDSGDWFDFLQARLGIPVGESKLLFVQYADGELPPTLAESQTVSLGFSMSVGGGTENGGGK